jgi:pimeloyl-ACP methyl ester carboxylesterase
VEKSDKMKIVLLYISLILGGSSFSFSSDSVEISVEGCTLKGTLVTQDDVSSATPLVILIAGSGPTDRNGNNAQMTNNSLKMLSDMLVENGYACLRYDKRAIGESKLDNFDQRKMNFDYFVSDASEWVNKYAADVRFNQIILAGHSQGSLVAMLAAKDNENVDAVISLAGAGQPIQEILKKQLKSQLSVQLQGVVFAKLDTLAMGDTLQVTPTYLHSIMHPAIQNFMISWMKYDPAKVIGELKVPILIINGSTDIQVDIEEAKFLSEGNPEAKLKIIKKMNHVLKFIKSKDLEPQLEVYENPELPLHEKLTKELLAFLLTLA